MNTAKENEDFYKPNLISSSMVSELKRSSLLHDSDITLLTGCMLFESRSGFTVGQFMDLMEENEEDPTAYVHAIHRYRYLVGLQQQLITLSQSARGINKRLEEASRTIHRKEQEIAHLHAEVRDQSDVTDSLRAKLKQYEAEAANDPDYSRPCHESGLANDESAHCAQETLERTE